VRSSKNSHPPRVQLRKIRHVVATIVFGAVFFFVYWFPMVAHADDIDLGVIAGISGLGSTYGKSIVQGAEMAVRDINGAGGINGRKVKLTIVDDASDPTRSAIAMRRLVSKNVDLIVGGWGSSQVLVNLDISEQAGLPYIVVGATHPQITSLNNKWTFRVIQTDSVMATQLVHLAVNSLGLKRIAIINDSNAYGRGSRTVFAQALAQLGVKPVSAQSYRTFDKDFRPQLKRIQAANPDGIAIFGTVPAAPTIMNQARELGIKARFLGTGGLVNNALLTLAPKAAEGAILMSFFDESPNADAQAWNDRIKQELADSEDISATVLAKWEYHAIRNIAAPCIESVGTVQSRLRDCIAQWRGELFGLNGEVYFDELDQLVQPSVTVEIRNGTFKPIRIQK